MSATNKLVRLELLATLVLALATVGTAWSAYQAREWTGEQAKRTARATATRISVNRTSALANRQVQIDVATFIAWSDAQGQDHDDLARYYRQRFRDEFKPAFAAWLAMRPLTSADAPPTPFAMPQYKLASLAEADRLDGAAAVLSASSAAANQRANNYMLAVVLFASALFFAGIATKLHSAAARMTLLVLGCVLLVGTLAWVVTFPIHVSI